ncbi:MAG TPA: NAD(P)/FAD-dependent oxidoreductase [Burkholderiales bacterium]|nr:NAD(P)/FAD-dependent oxidoreductase [Burkholderiales bacterium]
MFDLLVIGSGPGGYRAAVLAAQRGLSAAIAEKDAWGGACLNRGCVPKRDWYHTACIARAAESFAARGLRATLEPDPEVAWQHQRVVVGTVRKSYLDYLARLGVARFTGAARFLDSGRVAIGDEVISARNFVLATGSRPQLPEMLRGVPRVLTTDELFEAPLPAGRRIALLGSGTVGTEMAFILPRLGFEVVWLTGHEPLSRARFSASAKRRLRDALAAGGMRVRTGSRPERAHAVSDGVVLQSRGGMRERFDWVLAGTGRRPNTDALGLELAGVRTTSDGFVVVDDEQRTSVNNIFAIGDCANQAMTANHALAEATVAVANIVVAGARRSERAWVPEVIYSALELARAGANEDELDEADAEYAVGFSAFSVNPAALGEDAPEGYVRLLVARDAGSLLGCEIVGAQAGELIHLAGPGSAHAPLLERLARLPFNHPSRSEELLNAAETLVASWGMPAPL